MREFGFWEWDPGGLRLGCFSLEILGELAGWREIKGIFRDRKQGLGSLSAAVGWNSAAGWIGKALSVGIGESWGSFR